jgi:hypothetical protein
MIALVALRKSGGSLRNGHVGFERVILVVEADAHDFAYPSDAWPDARIAFHEWKCLGIQRAQVVERTRQEQRARYVRHALRQVTQLSALVDEARFFVSGASIAEKLHERTARLTVQVDPSLCIRRV